MCRSKLILELHHSFMNFHIEFYICDKIAYQIQMIDLKISFFQLMDKYLLPHTIKSFRIIHVDYINCSLMNQ